MEKPQSILVVEDDEQVGMLLRFALTSAGYEVRVVRDGQAALDYLEQSADLPALILLDLFMPKVDGWEFRARQLREPRLAPIPVVVVTALGFRTPLREFLNVPAYVEKPFRIDALLAEVRRNVRADSASVGAGPDLRKG